jgi:hypothetical protein
MSGEEEEEEKKKQWQLRFFAQFQQNLSLTLCYIHFSLTRAMKNDVGEFSKAREREWKTERE